MTVFDLAKKYYPRLWSLERLLALQKAGRLTENEVKQLTEGSDKEGKSE